MGDGVDTNNLLRTLGGIAGLAGIVCGILLLIFQAVLQQKFLPSAGLDSNQAFSVIMALIVLTFGTAGIGIIAWLIFAGLPPQTPPPPYSIIVLALLIIAVLASSVAVGSEAAKRSNTPLDLGSPKTSPQKTEAKGKQDVTRVLRVCTGEYERACQPHDAYLYCYVDVSAWAKGRCEKSSVQQLNSRGGNKCGYALYEVLCTSSL